MVSTLISSFIPNPKEMNFEGEDNDEKILYVFRRALITNVGWIFSSLMLFLLPLAFNVFLRDMKTNYPNMMTGYLIFVINLFWYVFAFGYFFERFLNWFFNVHIITSKRVVDMDFNSLLHRNTSEAPLRNIEDITFTVQGTLQTLFNYGSVNVQTAAEERELEFTHIDNPARIQDILSDLVSAIKSDGGS